MRVVAEEGDDRADRAGGAAVRLANARPDDGGFRLDLSERPAPIAGRDGDRRAAGAAARGDLDVASVHRAGTERIDRTEGVKASSRQADPMLGNAVRPRIGTDDALPIGIEDDEVACFKARQHWPDRGLADAEMPCKVGDRGRAALLDVEAKKGCTHIVLGRRVVPPHVLDANRLADREHGLASLRGGHRRPVREGHPGTNVVVRQTAVVGHQSPACPITRTGKATPAVAWVRAATVVLASSNVTSAVRLAIHAPLMPRLNSTSGTMQQDMDANAPSMPSAASQAWRLSTCIETRRCA